MYRFAGWYADADFKTLISTDTPSALKYNTTDSNSLVTDDEQETLTIYAKYNVVHYAIKYGIEGNDGIVLSDNDKTYLENNASFYERGRQEPDTLVIPQNDTGDIKFIEKGKFYKRDTYEFNVPGYTWNGWKAVDDVDDDGQAYDNKVSVVNPVSTTKYNEIFTSTDNLAESVIINGQFTPKYYYVSYQASKDFIKTTPTSDNQADVLNSSYQEVHQKTATWQGGDLDLALTSTSPTVAEKDGYIFAGWYTSPEPTDDDKPITDLSVLADLLDNDDLDCNKDTFTGDPKLTLYAVFTPLKYPVFYDIGFVNKNQDYEYPSVSFVEIENDPLTLPVLKRDGYTFNGWYADSDLTTAIPYSSDNGAWQFKTLYEKIYRINNPDTDDDTGSDTTPSAIDGVGTVDDEIEIPEDAEINLYASWSLDITLGITNKDVIFEIENDESTGRLEQGYSIKNYSLGSIVGIQYISPSNEEWDFAITSIIDNPEDYKVDPEASLLYTIEEYAEENGTTLEQAKQIFSELEIFEGLDINEEIENSLPKSQMYVHLRGEAYHKDTPDARLEFFNEHILGDTEHSTIIVQDYNFDAFVTFEYQINRDYSDVLIDLFHIDYKFGLESRS